MASGSKLFVIDNPLEPIGGWMGAQWSMGSSGGAEIPLFTLKITFLSFKYKREAVVEWSKALLQSGEKYTKTKRSRLRPLALGPLKIYQPL